MLVVPSCLSVSSLAALGACASCPNNARASERPPFSCQYVLRAVTHSLTYSLAPGSGTQRQLAREEPCELDGREGRRATRESRGVSSIDGGPTGAIYGSGP